MYLRADWKVAVWHRKILIYKGFKLRVCLDCDQRSLYVDICSKQCYQSSLDVLETSQVDNKGKELSFVFDKQASLSQGQRR